MAHSRILVVEDDSVPAVDLQERLRKLGFRVSAYQENDWGVSVETALQRHAMENQLRDNQEWFFTTLRSIGDAVVATDSEGRITFLNPQAETLTGWSQSEACGLPLAEVLQLERPAAHADEAEDKSSATATSALSSTLEAEVVSRDGERTPVEAKSALIRESSGKVLGVVRILRDVTDRKRAEEVFRRSERRYRNLVETSQDIIFTLSREGVLTSLNPAFEKCTGWPVRDWLYRPFADLLHPSDASPAWEAFRRVLRGEYFAPQEMRLKARGGGEIVVECGCAPATQEDGPGGVWGIARDITKRRNLEQRVLQTQKMEAVGRLAGGIAHDFNNLLMTVNGHADLMNQALEDHSPLIINVKGILGAVDKAAALTRQLLSISRQQTVSPRPLDLNAVVARILPGLNGLADENTELTVDLGAKLPAIMADANQIERVVSILIQNARDAMPKGGRLGISTGLEPTRAEGRDGPERQFIRVSDTGTGMTDEVKARLFEPFFTTKPVGKGAGLGLSTVYGIVKTAGGDLQVQTSPGQGTTFRLIFPCHEAGETAAASPAPIAAVPEARTGAETILLVEDDDDVRFLLHSILKADGYAVLEAKDGEQALAIAAERSETINLVLTDLQMPKLGGRKLVEKLLSTRPGMKAMFMSGFGREDFPDAQAHGLPVNFLEKPFMPKSLVRQIRKVLDS